MISIRNLKKKTTKKTGCLCKGKSPGRTSKNKPSELELPLYQRGKNPPLNECPVYDTKPSDGEALVLVWEMWRSPSLPLHSDLEW